MSISLFRRVQNDTNDESCPNQEWWTSGHRRGFGIWTAPPQVEPAYPGEDPDSDFIDWLGGMDLGLDYYLDTDDEDKWDFSDWSIKAKVAYSTALVLWKDRYMECHFAGCEAFRSRLRMGGALPKSEWYEWDESLIHFLGCYLHVRVQGPTKQEVGWHLHSLTKSIFSMFQWPDTLELGKEDAYWLFKYLLVFSWMDEWAEYVAPSSYRRDTDVKSALPKCMRQFMDNRFKSEVYGELTRLRIPGVCPASIASLAVTQPQHYGGVLAILEYLDLATKKVDLNKPKWPRRRHAGCNASNCDHAEEKTSNVEQLHVCHMLGRTHRCRRVKIPIEKLNGRFQNQGSWQSTAWDISSWDEETNNFVISSLLEGSNNYMAVSHVWSDGTGIGIHPGEVNSCLMSLWVYLAKLNDCKGLWWDAISLPMDKKARSLALETMSTNYARAEKVLIYDDDFAHSPWVSFNMTGAVVGLVLSTWFSRGWTAAEFAAASIEKAMTVIYHPSIPNRLVPVPLEGFMFKQFEGPHPLARLYLAGSPSGLNTQGNRWIPNMADLSAVNLIRLADLRKFGYDNQISHLTELSSARFESVINILRPRRTTKEEDRMTIASLMWSHSGNSPQGTMDNDMIPSQLGNEAEMTKAMVLKSRVIPHWAVFHGTDTMRQQGPWSWCPKSIFDFGNAIDSISCLSEVETQDLLYVDSGGVAAGWFYAIPLTAFAGTNKVQAYKQPHRPMVSVKVTEVLNRPETGALLLINRPRPGDSTQMALVVQMLSLVPQPIKIPRYKYDDNFISNDPVHNPNRRKAGVLRDPELAVRPVACRFAGCAQVALNAFDNVDNWRPAYCRLGDDDWFDPFNMPVPYAEWIFSQLAPTREAQLIRRRDSGLEPSELSVKLPHTSSPSRQFPQRTQTPKNTRQGPYPRPVTQQGVRAESSVRPEPYGHQGWPGNTAPGNTAPGNMAPGNMAFNPVTGHYSQGGYGYLP